MKIILYLQLLLICMIPVFGQESLFTTEEITFKNEEVELSGTLMLADKEGKSPAIVFLHGSGPHERAGFKPVAEAFAELGFSSLFFDKRGTGASGGSWITSSLEDLAKDGVAAIKYLKTRSEIDADQIGFWGVSQAGWVAPYAASLTDDVSFMIVISGGGASPRESELHSYNAWFTHMNFTQEEKDQCFEIIDDYMQFLSTGEDREALVSQLEAVSNKNVQMLAKQLNQILPSEKNRMNWEWVANYDPAEHLGRLNMPVLLLHGDKDFNQPTEVSNMKWEQAFEGRSDLLTTVVFPGAGHGIRMGGHNHGERGTYADGYWEVQLGWLWKNVIKN